MRKITKMLLTALAIGTVAGCGGEEARDAERDQAIVETVLRLAICSENGTLPIDPLGEPTKFNADDGKYVVIANSWVRDGETVNISWSTNREDAFEFIPSEEGNTTRANPIYPAFGEPAKGVSLTAKATLFEASATVRFVFYLYPPSAVFSRSDLGSIRMEAESKDRVWVEGFVFAMIENDWNLVYIADGNFGIALYRLDEGFPTVPDTINGGKRALAIGDYVKAIGKYSPYNGLAEVGWLETVEIIPVPDYAEAPKTKVLTEANFIDTSSLLGFDAAKVKLTDMVFTGKYSDKDGNKVDNLDLTGKEHRNVIFKIGETEIDLNVSYHIGGAKQTALRNFLNGLAAGEKVTFEGPLGWYYTPNLAFTDISQLSKA